MTNWIHPNPNLEYAGIIELVKLIQEAKRRDKMLNKYPVDPKTDARLQNDYTYHTPKDDQTERYTHIRTTAKTLAFVIVTNTPPSREQSIALTLLDEVVMMSNAAIARNE